MNIKRSVLEQIKVEHEQLRDDAIQIRDLVCTQIRTYDKIIKDLDEKIQSDILDTIKSTQQKHIDPKYCQHVNKNTTVHQNAKTVVCKDCNLMLSYEILQK